MLKRVSSLFLLVILPQIASADIAVSFFDVGQGDATLVQTTDGCSILIDAGRHDRNDVLNHLSAAGVQHIDYLIGTHPHADHIGQFPDILSRLPVGEVWMTGWEHGSRTFERTLDAILDSDAGYEEPRAGHMAACGNARLTVLHPIDPLTDIHDNLVVRVDYGEFSVIVTGDAEMEHEHQMIQRGEPLAATVLQLGHHGSQTSSSLDFLRAVSPQFAVYSAGAANSYGHPHEVVIQRVVSLGIPLRGTNQHGTIRIVSDGRNHSMTAERAGIMAEAGETGSSLQHSGERNPPGCIVINTAPASELARIVHIGDARASAIIEMRERSRFGSIEQLSRVPGIGPERLYDIISEGLACAE